MEKNSIKNTAGLICFYAAITVLGMLILSLLAHINFLKEAMYIYYYRMLCYVGIASGLLLLALFVFCFALGNTRRRFHVLRSNAIISALIISTLFSALFVTAGPMPIDRSYSIFSIADMYEHPDKIYTAEEIELAFTEKYIARNQATKRRIEEQKSIGNIEETDGGYRITEKGMRLIEAMRLVEAFYPADEKRTIYPGWE
jgi:hypothetical protein